MHDHVLLEHHLLGLLARRGEHLRLRGLLLLLLPGLRPALLEPSWHVALHITLHRALHITLHSALHITLHSTLHITLHSPLHIGLHISRHPTRHVGHYRHATGHVARHAIRTLWDLIGNHHLGGTIGIISYELGGRLRWEVPVRPPVHVSHSALHRTHVLHRALLHAHHVACAAGERGLLHLRAPVGAAAAVPPASVAVVASKLPAVAAWSTWTALAVVVLAVSVVVTWRAVARSKVPVRVVGVSGTCLALQIGAGAIVAAARHSWGQRRLRGVY